ncbi:hypothetical protein [Kitasatospora mediocidica]|uniref:hypothetical protein n=1 Tax=Kitasatospora mediocidica TaxID=58352 RepID=UPI000A47B928|nr:hypothetical protein [Kitasatospora mediocidica]
MIAAHRQPYPTPYHATPRFVGCRRQTLADMLRSRPDGGLLAALAGSDVLAGEVTVHVATLVADLGPERPPVVHLSLADLEDHDPWGRGPEGDDPAAHSVYVKATGPGVADRLYNGHSHKLLVAAISPAEPPEVALRRIAERLLVGSLLVGMQTPTRSVAMWDKGVRVPEATAGAAFGWLSLLVELETESGQGHWAGPALRAWTLWASLRRRELMQTTRAPRENRVLPRSGAIEVVAPDGSRSLVRITSARSTARPAPILGE